MKNKKKFYIGVCFIVAFVLWTVLLGFVDVQPIGPRDSAVGFATFNGFAHNITGANMVLYTVTDWLGLVPIGVAFGFTVLGVVQLIKRKSFLKVDRSILVLGAFYIVVIALYVLFEFVVVNRRPVLIDGYLETSYPSSTTMLVMCVMPTAAIQLNERIRGNLIRRCVIALIITFTAFMVIGRFLSGVHWATDIIGGALISIGLVMMYDWGSRSI